MKSQGVRASDSACAGFSFRNELGSRCMNDNDGFSTKGKDNLEDPTDKTEAELRQEIRRLARVLVPFPKFLGLSTVQAIEVEPAADVSSDIGCVVVCPDGELRELILRLIPGPIDLGGFEQTEEMRELELDGAAYIRYARAAVIELRRIMSDRAESF